MSARILVVDDEREIVQLIRRSLEMERFEVWEANDGQAALRTLQADTPDLILLDINLPFLDGFTVCKRIRDLGVRVPVIMLTGQTELDSRVRGLNSGADDYVGKPFDVPELIARVRAQLRRVDDVRNTAQELIRHKWEEINEGLMLAQSIQQPFRMAKQYPGLDTAVRYIPVGRIGGDFYNILTLQDGRTAFLIGDAVGKGLGASLLMASTFSLLTRLLLEEPSPQHLFERANSSLRADFANLGVFVAAFLGIWEPGRGLLTYCNAGHQAPVVFRRKPTIQRSKANRHRSCAPHYTHEFLSTTGLFLGAFDNGDYHAEQVTLRPGDRLWFYTDGLADLRDTSGQVVNIRRVYRRMLRSWNLPVGGVMAEMLDAFEGLAEGGVTLRDDLTAMLIEIGTGGKAIPAGC